jgi:Tfp pilus assembly protein PilX
MDDMSNPKTFIKNDRGSTMIIISLMLLALLTIISVAASKTARTELKIAGNEYLYQNNFYCAEGAVIETMDRLEALERVDVDKIDWLMNESEKVAKDTDLFGYWTDEQREDGDANPAGASICTQHTQLMGVHHGVLSGSSLDMTKPAKHIYSIYGQSNHRGTVLVKVGYAKAF